LKADPDTVLKALANPVRRRILQEVMRRRYARPRSILKAVGLSDRSLLSHEIDVLEEAGLVGRLRLDRGITALYPKVRRVTVTVGGKTSVTLIPEEELDGSEMVEQAVRLLWRVRRI
jgi:DNA-binding transcriptional ArsR family regulator